VQFNNFLLELFIGMPQMKFCLRSNIYENTAHHDQAVQMAKYFLRSDPVFILAPSKRCRGRTTFKNKKKKTVIVDFDRV
jgi:hypothetical protein